MKKYAAILLTVFFCLLIYNPVFAEDGEKIDTLINKQFEIVDIEGLDISTKKIIEDSQNAFLDGFSFKDMAMEFIQGDTELTFGNIVSGFAKVFFKEVYSQMYIIQRLVLIAVLSAMLKNLNSSFNGKSVGELSFYVCYIVLVFIIMASFKTAGNLVSNTAQDMSSSMQAFLPIFTGLVFTSGNYTLMTVAGPVVIGAAQIISSAITYAVLPAITMVTVLHMINFLSEKNILGQLSDLFKSMIHWGLKGMAILFMTVVSLLRIGTPNMNKLVGKTARAAVGAVPVVGDVMTGAVDMAASLSGTVKNSVAACAVVFIILLCLMPMIKLVVMILIYKFTAAVLEPVCEARLIKCISSAGDFSVLLLGALFTVEIMFVFSVIVLFSTA